MCPPVVLALGAAATTYGLMKKQNKQKQKANAATAAKINALNKQTEEKIAFNQLANTTQSTEELKNPTLADKLKTQKVPLNTANTGATMGSPTSVGLNLGGY